jgi:hypothetical protein
VISDDDEADYNDYYGDMPWAAVPYEGEKREEVSAKFDVRVIPQVIVLRGEAAGRYAADALCLPASYSLYPSLASVPTSDPPCHCGLLLCSSLASQLLTVASSLPMPARRLWTRSRSPSGSDMLPASL